MARKIVIPYAKLAFNCRCCLMIPWRLHRTFTAGGWFSPSVWCVRARDDYSDRDVSPDPSSDRNSVREKLWRRFFSDRSQWWDQRSEKVNLRYPDFKHKKTQQGLWIIDNLTPPWVKAELATERCASADGVRCKAEKTPGPISDRKLLREQLWRDFFSDPSQWWDNRSEKVNPRYPDFKHKKTQQGLWIIDNITPPWVEAELATMSPGLLQPDSSSWNLRLRRHVTAQDYTKTLNLYQQMQREGMVPDKFTFVPVLNACSHLRSLEEGRRVHAQIIQKGFEPDVYIATCLIGMYAKCGSIEDAWSVFNRMRERTVVSWTAMIGAYVNADQGLKALELFHNMHQEGVEPNTVTFAGVLNACANIAALDEGRRVHKQIIQRGCDSDVRVANCLVDMYAKCGSIEQAWTVFNKMREHTVVSWTAIIVGYVKSEQGLKALALFRRMQEERVEPNAVTFAGVLNACASLADLEEGRRVHEQIIQRGCESDVYVANCLVDMYAKCASIDDAWCVFNKMRERTVISWTAMIVGYVKSEGGLKALELFRKMQQEGVEPNNVTFVGVLNACASVAALEEGRRVHKQIIQSGYESDVNVTTCLVDMYAKCGSTNDAQRVFNKMRKRDVVSWNAMIGGYAMHAQFQKAIQLFERMDQEGIEIDEITFISLLSACSHGGLVEEGLHYFQTMLSHYSVCPTREHYACMVDLLGRAGRLVEAEELAEEMMKRVPMEIDSCVWMSLLGACRIHGNIQMAEQAARRCLKLDPENASAHLLLSNIHAAAGQWGDGAAVHEKMLKRTERKVPGCTWIEVKNEVHSFVVNDKDGPQMLQIHTELDRLSVQLNEEGYIQDRRFLSPEEDCHLLPQREAGDCI